MDFPPVCWPCVVVCGDFAFFKFTHVRVLSVVLWGDFEFFKVPRVWALCCGVWGLWLFSNVLCVWAICVVVCKDFEFFKVPLCVGSVLWCVGTLRFSIPPVCEHLVNFIYSMKMWKKFCKFLKVARFLIVLKTRFLGWEVYCSFTGNYRGVLDYHPKKM